MTSGLLSGWGGLDCRRPVKTLLLSASARTAGESDRRRFEGSKGSFTKTFGSGRGLVGALECGCEVPGVGWLLGFSCVRGCCREGPGLDS